MRFRGVITDGQQIQTLIRVLQSFSKFSDTFSFRLSQNELHLINDFSQISSPFVVKCILRIDDYFEEYSFVGNTSDNTSDNNIICFRLRSESLNQILSSFKSYIKALKLKLSKSCIDSHNDIVLSVAVNYPTHTDSDRNVCHKIKIDIFKSEEWDEMCGHESHNFDLSLILSDSDSRLMTTTIERLSDLSQYIDLRAKRVDSNKAFLIISLETDSLSFKSKFKDLSLNTSEDIGSNNCDNLVVVRIDSRKMNLIFNTLKQIKANHIIANITDKNKICFQFFHNFINFEAFLPNIDS